MRSRKWLRLDAYVPGKVTKGRGGDARWGVVPDGCAKEDMRLWEPANSLVSFSRGTFGTTHFVM